MLKMILFQEGVKEANVCFIVTELVGSPRGRIRYKKKLDVSSKRANVLIWGQVGELVE